jgi:hypothetical protein
MQAPPPKAVYLLGADDYEEADVPADAFVIYQVGSSPAVNVVGILQYCHHCGCAVEC